MLRKLENILVSSSSSATPVNIICGVDIAVLTVTSGFTTVVVLGAIAVLRVVSVVPGNRGAAGGTGGGGGKSLLRLDFRLRFARRRLSMTRLAFLLNRSIWFC